MATDLQPFPVSPDPTAHAPAPAVVVDAAPQMMPTGGGGGGKSPVSSGKRKKETDHGLGNAVTDRVGGADAVDVQEDDQQVGGKTLGERALEVEQGTGGGKTPKDSRGEDEKIAATDLAIQEALGNKDKGAPPKADSLAVLFTQALMADDRVLVERCLSVGDASVIENTVERLPAVAVVKLLKAALARMRTKPGRGDQLGQWMRAALTHHSSYLSSSPHAKNTVLELTQVIDAHQALQRPLLSLLGRLDLLLHKQNVSRAVRKKKDDADGDESDGTEGPVNVYDETSDLDVMDEDMAGEGESEEDWETDSDEGGEESGEDEDEDGNGESDSE